MLLSKLPRLPGNPRHDIQLWGFETSPGQSTSYSRSKTNTICTGLAHNRCCLAPELYKFPVVGSAQAPTSGFSHLEHGPILIYPARTSGLRQRREQPHARPAQPGRRSEVSAARNWDRPQHRRPTRRAELPPDSPARPRTALSTSPS